MSRSFDELVARADRAAQRALGGEIVTYTPTVGPPVTPTGMFDENFVLAKGEAEAGVAVSGTAVFLRLADLPSDPRVDKTSTLTIRGVVYKHVSRHPDDQGGIVLFLRKA